MKIDCQRLARMAKIKTYKPPEVRLESTKMREIGQLDSTRSASALADFLLAKGIKTETRANAAGDRFSIWVIDENRLSEARADFVEFQANPADARFAAAARTAREVRRAEAKADRDYARRVTDAGDIYSAGGLMRKTPVVKYLIVACVIVSLWSNFGKRMTADRENLISLRYINLASPRFDMNDGWVIDDLKPALTKEPWRLVAPMFLHLSWLHLFCNMSFLTYFGGMIEREKRSWFFLALVVFTHIVSAFSEYFLQVYGMHDKVIMFGGFSGAGYGLFGFVWMYAEYNSYGYIRMSRQNFQYGLIWLVLCFTGVFGPIANGAHFGGMVAGMLVGIIVGKRDAAKQLD